jgi:hypothetical protein
VLAKGRTDVVDTFTEPVAFRSQNEGSDPHATKGSRYRFLEKVGPLSRQKVVVENDVVEDAAHGALGAHGRTPDNILGGKGRNLAGAIVKRLHDGFGCVRSMETLGRQAQVRLSLGSAVLGANDTAEGGDVIVNSMDVGDRDQPTIEFQVRAGDPVENVH